MKIKIIVFLFLCLLLGGLASAGDVININPGMDQISAAMANAKPGDILELADGVYWESNTINTIVGDFTIRGVSGGEAIIYGPSSTEGDLIHVYGNLWLENVVLVGSEKSVNGIVNYFGGVDTDGGEFAAEKNNIYINNCISLVFVQNHIIQVADDPKDFEDDKWHPIDTLRVTNSLFYGADITNDRAIYVGQRQARYIEVRNSTFWSLGLDALEVQGGYVGDDYDNPGPGSDLQYVTTIADHLTIFNTYNNSPEQYVGRGGDGIHYEWANRKQSMTNCIAFRTGRFCFKGKRGEPELTVADFCMGDSANVSGDYSPPTVYYWTMTKGANSWEANPEFNDHWNGDFSLNTNLSDAIGTASDGSNMGDPHWDDPATHWPKKTELEAIIAKAKTEPITAVNDGQPVVAMDFSLHPNYPNPFNPATTISFTLANRGVVFLDIYNLGGVKVRILVQEVRETGRHTVVWDGLDDRGKALTSGIYFSRLRSGPNLQIMKMTLIK